MTGPQKETRRLTVEEIVREDLAIEHVRVLLSIAVTTYNEKPEAERERYLRVVAGSLVRCIADRLGTYAKVRP